MSKYKNPNYQKDYYRCNQDKYLAYAKEHYRNNIVYYLHKSAKRRAKLKGLVFDIDVSDITIPIYCPVFGFKLSSELRSNTSPSIDRIDNTMGYTKGNIQVISDLANRMKSNATPEQLLTFANWILDIYA